MKLFKILILFLFIYSFLNAKVEFNLSFLKKIDYDELDSFDGLFNSTITILNDTTITFWNDKHYLFNTKKYVISSFGNKGKGPGEFLKPSNLIEIANKRYCVDNQKRSLMIFDTKNKFIKEKKLDFFPTSISSMGNQYLCITNIPMKKKDKILNVYSLDGKLLRKELNTINEISKFKSYPKLSFVYSKVFPVSLKDKLNVFFNWVPYYIKYNTLEKEAILNNYASQLPYKVYPPVIKIDDGNIFTAGLYWNEIIGNYKNFLLFRASTRKSLKEKDSKEFYFIMDENNFKIEMIDFKPENVINNGNIFIFNGKLFVFDDDNGELKIYKVSVK